MGPNPGRGNRTRFLGDASIACARLVGSYRTGQSLGDLARRGVDRDQPM